MRLKKKKRVQTNVLIVYVSRTRNVSYCKVAFRNGSQSLQTILAQLYMAQQLTIENVLPRERTWICVQEGV